MKAEVFGLLDANNFYISCEQVRKRVRRWTGIPTCIGVGPTKTLAKVANWLAKKRPEFGGVCDLRDPRVRGGVAAHGAGRRSVGHRQSIGRQAAAIRRYHG